MAQVNAWVMDYETLSNFSCGVFTHYKTDETKIFVIHDLRNDLDEFIDFLKDNIEGREKHISFNGLGFDAQITEFILDNAYLLNSMRGCEAAQEIYKYAQQVIEKSNNREWLDYPPFKLRIPQIDLYKLNHWDNVAKRSSLKWIEFSMNWDNVQDMPLDHTHEVTTQEEVDMIVDYCINDVKATKRIMELSKGQINLRNTLTKEFNIDLFSASETKIAKELFLHFLHESSGIPKKELKASKTVRSNIPVKDILLDYYEFKTERLNDIYEKFKKVNIDPDNTKGALKLSVNYQGMDIDFGLGGIHGATDSGTYKSDDDFIIMSSDV